MHKYSIRFLRADEVTGMLYTHRETAAEATLFAQQRMTKTAGADTAIIDRILPNGVRIPAAIIRDQIIQPAFGGYDD